MEPLLSTWLASIERSLNAAASINNYAPASIDELIKNNELFRKKVSDLALMKQIMLVEENVE